MKFESNIRKEDYDQICSVSYIPWEELRDKTIFITGASGLIGSNLVYSLLYADMKKELNLTILALVRDEKKGKTLLDNQPEGSHALSLVNGTVEELPEISGSVDYIIHAANPTASSYFVTNPVETIYTALTGTKNMLELARKKCSAGFIYLSSMEIYGCPQKGCKVTEEDIAGFNPSVVRNCYPVSKQMCETLCCAYAAEYKVPAKSVRLTQTFGPGVTYSDSRVFAEFMRCAVEQKDIVLKTKGETERSYLDTADAVSAILTVLLKGISGQSYTAANPDTYCSIKDMAEIVAKDVSEGRIRVVIDDTNDTAMFGYADTLYMDLDISKLRNLGWFPTKQLNEMFLRMISSVD